VIQFPNSRLGEKSARFGAGQKHLAGDLPAALQDAQGNHQIVGLNVAIKHNIGKHDADVDRRPTLGRAAPLSGKSASLR
jgi:hypothetical protein